MVYDSPTDSLTLDDVHALVPNEGVWERGLRLFQQGAVEAPVRRGARLLGRVAGSADEPYTVEATPPLTAGLRWQWHCTCYYYEMVGAPCKHLVALLLMWSETPDRFAEERPLDEEMGGPRRAESQAERREALRRHPVLAALLALEPERKRPLKRALNLDPYRQQLDYAARQDAAHPWEGILQTAAGYLRIRDASNALRLTTLLIERLLAVPSPPARLRAVTHSALLLLEAAALAATLAPDERNVWLAQVQGWWAQTEDPTLRDRLLDLVLHTYHPDQAPAVVPWLRGLLRLPRQHNRRSSAAWRARVVRFLLASYEAAHHLDEFEQLCWEEGEDARAAYKLAEVGELARALRIAATGLGNSQAHQAVAQLLHDSGEVEAAEQVARRGLHYDDETRPQLLAWLARYAQSAERALEWAEASWQAAPSQAHFRLLREAAQRTGAWEARLPDVMRTVLSLPLPERAMILAEAGHYDDAIALLPQAGWQRETLTERLAEHLAGPRPADAIALWVALANHRVAERSRPAYQRAAQALHAARTVAEQSDALDTWEQALHTFRAEHSRLRALWEEVEALLDPLPD